MRSLRVSKAPPLPTWLGHRVNSSNATPARIEDERKGLACATSNATPGHVTSRLHQNHESWVFIAGKRSGSGVATFSTGGSGRISGRRKDPGLLLGAGWEKGGDDVAVAVWWDFENCNVPIGIEVYKVGVNIVSGLRMSGFKGPVSISAYGDTLQLSRSTQEALTSTGIRLHHIPSGGKDSSDRALLVDLILWTFEHPPPAHLLLISGDRDFSNALHRLRMMNYNILLACPAGSTVSPALLGAATHVWQWNILVRGEGLLQANPPPDFKPPDGEPPGGGNTWQSVPKPTPPPVSPPSVWSKGVEEYSISSHGERKPHAGPIPPALGSTVSECKETYVNDKKVLSTGSLRQVQQDVLRQFKNILISNPQGILFSDLQSHIATGKVPFEKDFYGFGKLVPFLSSMPNIVKLERVLTKDMRSWTYLLTSPSIATQRREGGSLPTKQEDQTTPMTEGVQITPNQEIQKTPRKQEISKTELRQEIQSTPPQQGALKPAVNLEIQRTAVKVEAQKKSTVKEEETLKTLVKEETQKTPVKQETKMPAVKQETQKTAVKQETPKTPVKQETQKTAVKQETPKTPVKQENQRTAVKPEVQKTAVKQDDQKTAVKQQEAQKTALKQEAQKTPVKHDIQKTAVKQGAQKTEVKQETQKNALKQQEAQKPALKQEAQKTPVKHDIQKTAVKQGAQKTEVKQETQKTALKQQEAQKPPLKQEAQKTPVKHDIQKTAVKQGAQKTSVKQETQKIPMKQETQQMSVKEEIISSSQSCAKVIQATDHSSPALPMVETLDQEPNEQSQLPELNTFLAPLINKFRQWMGIKFVDSRSTQEMSGLSADKPTAEHEDYDHCPVKECAEDSKKSDLRISVSLVKSEVCDLQTNDSELVTTVNSHERVMESEKGSLCPGDGVSEEKVEASLDDVGSENKPRDHSKKETVVDQTNTISSRQADNEEKGISKALKKLLFGTKTELSLSALKGSMTESTTPPVDFDFSDLDKVTWKELLRPTKLVDSMSGSPSELISPQQPTIEVNKSETLMGNSNIMTEGHEIGEDSSPRQAVLEDLKDYLCSAEGSAILMKNPNQIVVVACTIKMVGPLKLRSLQTDEITEAVEQFLKTKDSMDCNLSREPSREQGEAQECRASDSSSPSLLPENSEGNGGRGCVQDGRQLDFDARRLTKTLTKDTKAHIEVVVSEDNPDFQEGASRGVSRHHVLSKGMEDITRKESAELLSCKTSLPTSSQDGQSKSLQNESLSLGTPSPEHVSSSATSVPLMLSKDDAASCPNLEKFQEACLPTSKQDGQTMILRNESHSVCTPCPSSSTIPAQFMSSKDDAVSCPSLEKFQEWFLESLKKAYKLSAHTQKHGFDLSLLKPDFEREFGVRLDPRLYGFFKLQDLVASISFIRVLRPRCDQCVVYLLKEDDIPLEQQGDTRMSVSKISLWPQMYQDCKILLQELLLESPEGLPGSRLKPLFMSRFGYPLDHKRVGYQRMSDLLRLMPDIVSVNGRLLVPSKEFLLSVKKEMTEKEAHRNVGLPSYRSVDVDVQPDTCTQISEDVGPQRVVIESPVTWGEIDIEMNGSLSPLEEIREVPGEDTQGLQGRPALEIFSIKDLSVSKHSGLCEPFSAEYEPEGMCHAQPGSSSVDDKSSSGEKYQGHFNINLPHYDEGTDSLSRELFVPVASCTLNQHILVEVHGNLVQMEESSAEEQFDLNSHVSLGDAGKTKELSSSDVKEKGPALVLAAEDGASDEQSDTKLLSSVAESVPVEDNSCSGKEVPVLVIKETLVIERPPDEQLDLRPPILGEGGQVDNPNFLDFGEEGPLLVIVRGPIDEGLTAEHVDMKPGNSISGTLKVQGSRPVDCTNDRPLSAFVETQEEESPAEEQSDTIVKFAKFDEVKRSVCVDCGDQGPALTIEHTHVEKSSCEERSCLKPLVMSTESIHMKEKNGQSNSISEESPVEDGSTEAQMNLNHLARFDVVKMKEPGSFESGAARCSAVFKTTEGFAEKKMALLSFAESVQANDSHLADCGKEKLVKDIKETTAKDGSGEHLSLEPFLILPESGEVKDAGGEKGPALIIELSRIQTSLKSEEGVKQEMTKHVTGNGREVKLGACDSGVTENPPDTKTSSFCITEVSSYCANEFEHGPTHVFDSSNMINEHIAEELAQSDTGTGKKTVPSKDSCNDPEDFIGHQPLDMTLRSNSSNDEEVLERCTGGNDVGNLSEVKEEKVLLGSQSSFDSAGKDFPGREMSAIEDDLPAHSTLEIGYDDQPQQEQCHTEVASKSDGDDKKKPAKEYLQTKHTPSSLLDRSVQKSLWKRLFRW